jgi:hypothetical protein
MIELIINDTFGYDGKIYITDNAYDVMRFIVGRDEDVRILYDDNIHTWYIGKAADHVHRAFILEGWRNGLYHDYVFKTEDDVLYYYGNTEFVYLYYYKTEPFEPNLTGDYEVHYVYDFGILDSHDILNTTVLKFENTDLYEILLPRLVRSEIEPTKENE